MINIIGGILKNITGFFKQRGDGINRSILKNVTNVNTLKQATNCSEKINKIVMRNLDKFNKRDRNVLLKYIDKFDSLD